MKKALPIPFFCAIMLLLGCTDAMQEVVEMNVAQNSKSPLTRASTFEVETDTTTQSLVETPEMKNLKEQVTVPRHNTIYVYEIS